MRTVERRSLAAEDRDLARQIGTKLRTARHAAGLTQQQVAAGRYTKAYVSALENGLIKPSMAALRFLAVRLGTTPSELLAESDTRWARLDAELRLAAGDFQSAADGFSALLDAAQGAERGRRTPGTQLVDQGRPPRTVLAGRWPSPVGQRIRGPPALRAAASR